MSNKEYSKYFKHDSNARHSQKMIQLRMKYGAEGYGIYFMILEIMRESKNYCLSRNYDLIAYDLRVDSKIIKDIVENFDLFSITDDEQYFFSEGFIERMALMDDKEKKRSESGKKAAEARWQNVEKSIDECERNANAMRTHNEPNANAMLKQNKTKQNTIQQNNTQQNKTKKEKQEKENGSSKSTRGELESYISSLEVGEELKTALKDFVEMRQKIKKPLTLRALELTVKDLNKLSSDEQEQVLIVQKSVKRSWQGVFALDDKDKQELKQSAETDKYAFLYVPYDELHPEEGGVVSD